MSTNGNAPDLKALTADLLDQVLPGRPMSQVVGRAGRRQAQREQSERAKLEAFCQAVLTELIATKQLALNARTEARQAAEERIERELSQLMAQRDEVVRLTAEYEAILSEVAPDLLTRLQRAHRGD